MNPSIVAGVAALFALFGCARTEPLPTGCYYGIDPRAGHNGIVPAVQILGGKRALIAFPGNLHEVELVRVYPLWGKSYALSDPGFYLGGHVGDSGEFQDVIESNTSRAAVEMPLSDGSRPTIGIPWSPDGYWNVTLRIPGVACPVSQPPHR